MMPLVGHRPTRDQGLETPDQGESLLAGDHGSLSDESVSSADELIGNGGNAAAGTEDRKQNGGKANSRGTQNGAGSNQRSALDASEDKPLQCCGMSLKGVAKFLVGILLLLVVDIIWVASAAATKVRLCRK